MSPLPQPSNPTVCLLKVLFARPLHTFPSRDPYVPSPSLLPTPADQPPSYHPTNPPPTQPPPTSPPSTRTPPLPLEHPSLCPAPDDKVTPYPGSPAHPSLYPGPRRQVLPLSRALRLVHTFPLEPAPARHKPARYPHASPRSRSLPVRLRLSPAPGTPSPPGSGGSGAGRTGDRKGKGGDAAGVLRATRDLGAGPGGGGPGPGRRGLRAGTWR